MTMEKFEQEFKRKKPIFTKGRILKNEMLELLRDFPRNITDIFLATNSDGVISGLDLQVDKTDIAITPGIVKYQGEILTLGSELKVPYVADGSVQILKLQFQERYETKDFAGQDVRVILESGGCNQNEMEVARFRLSQGAYLRSDYQDFEDFKTGHNTLNIVNQPYSSISGQTLSPAILKYFARELLKYRTENPHDLAIIYQVLNSEISISKELLINYIMSRLKESIESKLENNEDLHKGLTQVLKKAKLEDRGGRRTISGNRRLIVD